MKLTPTNLADYQRMVDLFEAESDRGAAVLAGSYLENQLAHFLTAKMVDKSPALVKEIFDSNGALSTFYQRIQIAQAFGFLSSSMCSQLGFISKIRNRFAHHPLETRFDDQKVTSWIAQLKALMPMDTFGSDLYAGMDARGVYMVHVAVLFLEMHLSETNAKIIAATS